MMDSPELTAEEERLVRVVTAALIAHGAEQRIDAQLHAEHHRAVAEWIARENRKRERWEKIMQSTVGSLLVAGALALVSGLCWLGRLALAGAQAAQHSTGGNPPPGH
jgi:hypothetical protein